MRRWTCQRTARDSPHSRTAGTTASIGVCTMFSKIVGLIGIVTLVGALVACARRSRRRECSPNSPHRQPRPHPWRSRSCRPRPNPLPQRRRPLLPCPRLPRPRWSRPQRLLPCPKLPRPRGSNARNLSPVMRRRLLPRVRPTSRCRSRREKSTTTRGGWSTSSIVKDTKAPRSTTSTCPSGTSLPSWMPLVIPCPTQPSESLPKKQ